MITPAFDPTASDTLLADIAAEAPVTASAVSFAGRVWDVRRETVLVGGATVVRDFIDHPGAVGVVALDAEDRVALIRQYRHPARARMWEIPAGLLDVAGESALAAAQRELAEEADLAADSWGLLLDLTNSPGSSSEMIRVFVAQGLRSLPPHPRTEEEAELEHRWVPLKVAVSAVLAGQVRNGTFAAAMLAAAAARNAEWSTLRDPQAPWPGTQRGGVRPGDHTP